MKLNNINIFIILVVLSKHGIREVFIMGDKSPKKREKKKPKADKKIVVQTSILTTSNQPK